MKTLKDRLYESGILAMAGKNNLSDAAQSVRELCEGGVSALVLWEMPGVENQIAAIRMNCPNCLIGVYGTEQIGTTVALSADFCICPATQAERATSAGSVIPSYASVELLREANASLELAYLDAAISIAQLRKLYVDHPQLALILNSDGQRDSRLLLEPNVLALANKRILSGRGKISDLACSEIYRTYEISSGHLGINAADYQEATDLAQRLSSLLGRPTIETWRSYLIGTLVEVMHYPYRGENGHFGILTNNLLRAMQFFRTRGMDFDMTTYEENAIVYFCGNFGGFEIHLTQRKNKIKNHNNLQIIKELQ